MIFSQHFLGLAAACLIQSAALGAFVSNEVHFDGQGVHLECDDGDLFVTISRDAQRENRRILRRRIALDRLTGTMTEARIERFGNGIRCVVETKAEGQWTWSYFHLRLVGLQNQGDVQPDYFGVLCKENVDLKIMCVTSHDPANSLLVILGRLERLSSPTASYGMSHGRVLYCPIPYPPSGITTTEFGKDGTRYLLPSVVDLLDGK